MLSSEKKQDEGNWIYFVGGTETTENLGKA